MNITWAVVVVLLQWIVAPMTSIGGVRADFVFIFVLYLGMYGSPTRAMLAGFLLGLVVDIVTWSPHFGLNSLVWTITGFIPHYFRARLFLTSPATQLAFVFTFSLGADLIRSFFYLTVGLAIATGFLQRTALHIGWSLVLFMLFYQVWKRYLQPDRAM